MAFQTALLAVLAALAAAALASPLSPRWWINPAPVCPKVKSSSLVGVLDDPTLQRDSCGSVKWDGRLLWVCRDTEFLVNESIHDLVTNNTLYGFATSSASYTNFAPGGGPDVEPLAPNPYIPFENQVPQYGYNSNETNFYPLSPDQCSNNTAGNCYDGTRFALWPSVPPLVTSWDGGLTAYTWVRNEHITNTLGVVTPDPSTTLYRVTSAPWGSAGDVLPSAEIVDEFFWQENDFAYGDYGSVLFEDTVYLYAQASNHSHIALAKAPADQVEDSSAYSYYVSGEWTATPPTSINDTRAYLEHPGAGGQGTYYWSNIWGCFVWLGQTQDSVVPNLMVSTAPAPEGPWIEPYLLYELPGGNYTLSGYSIQAHPGLAANEEEIYVSYTKVDAFGDNFGIYTQPLYKFEWQ